MWLSMRHGVVTITLAACVALVAAAQTGRGSRGGSSTGASAMDETNGSVGASRRAATRELSCWDMDHGSRRCWREALAIDSTLP
jgi:hypothetical protein